MAPTVFDEERFSRWMAYVLRHNPAKYALEPDRHGFVPLEQFLPVVRRRNPELTEARLRELVAGTLAQRFEIAHDAIRARYGHTIAVEPATAPVEPPERLYHGTEPGLAVQIFAEGLKPMGRQMLHLSVSVEDAIAVARRRTDRPLVIRVHAKQAHEAGRKFFREGAVFLTDEIPPEFLARDEGDR